MKVKLGTCCRMDIKWGTFFQNPEDGSYPMCPELNEVVIVRRMKRAGTRELSSRTEI